jgi:hypothetical protein
MERRPARASQDARRRRRFSREAASFSLSILLSEKRNRRYGVFELFRLSPLLVGWAAILFERNSED